MSRGPVVPRPSGRAPSRRRLPARPRACQHEPSPRGGRFNQSRGLGRRAGGTSRRVGGSAAAGDLPRFGLPERIRVGLVCRTRRGRDGWSRPAATFRRSRRRRATRRTSGRRSRRPPAAEEPPLQAVEEVRAVVELGQLDRRQRGRRGGVLARRSTKPPYTSRSEGGPDRRLEMARVERSLDPGAVAGAVDAHPAGDGDLARRAARARRGRAAVASAASQPRSTSSEVPSAVTSGTTTSTPDVAVAGPVAHDHGVVDVVRRRWRVTTRHSSLVGDRARPGARTSATGGGRPVSLVRTTALLALRSASRPNCHPPSHQRRVADDHDGERRTGATGG